VVTSVDVSTAKPVGASETTGFLIIGASTVYGSWDVPTDGFTHSFPYPGGIAIPAGFVFNNPSVLGPNNSSFVVVNGYLTPI
jgi:hypothetical protein